MIKKSFFVLTGLMLCINCYANIHLDGAAAGQVMREYIDQEHLSDAIRTYNAYLKKSGNWTISPKDLYKVCASAGWDISSSKGKQKCDVFVNALLKKATYRYYNVCGDQKGKTGGTEYCVTAFYDIEVQKAQAKNLAIEYAKVKYNDDIVCSLNLGTGVSLVQEYSVQDYLRCVSKNKNVFYEFEFDDAKESNTLQNKFVRREFANGLCIIYGGSPRNFDEKKPRLTGDKISASFFYSDREEELPSSCLIMKESCDSLNTKIRKFGYKSSVTRYGNEPISNRCSFVYTGGSATDVSQDYYAKFDGDSLSIFHNGKVIKKWPARAGRGKTPKDSRKTVCQTPKYQACKNIGPTPAGEYWISQNEIQYLDNVTFGNYQTWKFWGNAKQKNLTMFGESRVLLVPSDSTNIFEREKDMYIHGGDVLGSAGCIDLATNISDFMDWFAKQTDFVKLKVVVDYGSVREICGDNCTGSSVCTRCECKKEINKDTKETNCDYI